MGRVNTELVNGLHLVKFQTYGETARVTIPISIARALAISNGSYYGLRQIGECIVLTKVTQLEHSETQEEFAESFERAVRAWEKLEAQRAKEAKK